MAEQAALGFGGLLRQLRGEARLTQEELAEAADLSPRSVSDLERGINRTARKDTAELLAGALGLAGPARVLFVAAARGRGPADDVLAAREGTRPGAFAAAATRALPRDIASFTGRRAELAQLLGSVAAAAVGGGLTGIWVIGGMAGAGKTAFAVRAAHQLAGSFPDGQFYLPLHAHTRGQQPVEPADALGSLLLTAGLATQHLPPGTETRAARWRDFVAGKKILLLLDDAAGHEQVRPLLPGAAGSLVLVTSRRRLTALDDSAVISLGALSPGEAAALLARLAARPGIGAADAAVGEITRLCGYLPLAIGMLARQLSQHPAWTAGDLAASLAAARDRLAAMRAENLSVAAAFDLSYADLAPARPAPGATEKLTGQYPAAAGSLAGAAALYRDLGDQSGQAHALYSLGYLHALTGDYPAATATHEQALALARGCGDQLAEAAVRAGLGRVQRLTGEHRAAAANLASALDLYRGLGHRPGQAVALTELGSLQRLTGDYPAAATSLQRSLELCRSGGDRPGEADALYELGMVQQLTGDHPAAATSLQQVLDLCHDLGSRLGQAEALNGLGELSSRTSESRRARDQHTEALAIARDLGVPLEEARALEGIGHSHLHDGSRGQAAAHLRQALAIYQRIGAPRARQAQETLRHHRFPESSTAPGGGL